MSCQSVRAVRSVQALPPYRRGDLVEAGHRAVSISEAQQLDSADSAKEATGRLIIRCSHD
ncbi:hypothetical protein BHD05_12635 [Marisediminicola antarctica]|uniref:Uncharacterized protein n=1 Tax=Marisediminicola antarctica TaxID=674079 RepID=A0A7L5AJZ3_9MICO|nr:hypothetical protein BHD05_12635 [Marisediminicola antarctica]